jgi:hypothetical protein
MDVAIESCVGAGLDQVVVVLGAAWLTPVPLSVSPPISRSRTEPPPP